MVLQGIMGNQRSGVATSWQPYGDNKTHGLQVTVGQSPQKPGSLQPALNPGWEEGHEREEWLMYV